MSQSPDPIDPSTGQREPRSRKGFLASAWSKLKFWQDRDRSPENELALESEAQPRFILPCRKRKWKKKRQKIQLRNMQKRQTTLQLRQDELLKYQRQVAGLHDPIHLIIKSNPVIYHVDYSDITTVGKIKRKRNRSYVYRSDHDFVRRDWEKAMDRHSQNYPVIYNRSAIKGTSFGVKLRPIRDGKGWFFWRKKPAKIRVQKLRVLKEFPAHPHRLSIYEIRKKSKYPSVTLSVLGNDQFSASIPQRAPVRWKHSTPLNTVVMFVPQQEAWVVERMGKYHKILEPGVNVLVPVIDRVKYVQSLKEIAIDIPQQSAITIDNVNLNIDGILYLRVTDPYNASYGVEDPEFAITQLAQTTMRSEIGKITLDTLFRERENLNLAIVTALNDASEAWGISCMRYEIRDIRMPSRVQEAMQMQVEAERKKRAAILESEGIKAAEINVAEGKKQSRILSSEAEKQELINAAHGAAEAVVAAGRARAESIALVAEALHHHNGHNAASLAVAEKYVTAFQALAKTNNTLILPANAGDVSNMVAQAMTIYNQVQRVPSLSGDSGNPASESEETQEKEPKS
ncbi:hypothetical protein TCAL_11140 [Tigriopus californicus]|uniref:Band 7 domain-containing protein n=1 Tax=Tigriopus californicus TaxID=6832 RepID=A0A553NQC8_TIGCA|nr:hypothetical protein TCAL_11140 [Tigriopus californicus]